MFGKCFFFRVVKSQERVVDIKQLALLLCFSQALPSFISLVIYVKNKKSKFLQILFKPELGDFLLLNIA